MGNPFPVSLPSESRKAAKIVRDFTSPDRVDQVVPASVLARAKGFAIFSVFRIGFLMSARGGAGVVVARLADGTWSPPAAIGLGGLGGGFNAGAEVTDFLIVLTSRRAVSTFMATGSLQLGGNMALAIGPLGRAAEAGGSVSSTGKLAAMLSYSKSKGLYGGISLEGTILMDRADANAKAYGSGVTGKHILAGKVETPDFAYGLQDILNRVSGRPPEGSSFYDDDSSIVSPTPSNSYGDAGYGGARRGRGHDPFGDSDSEHDDYGATWRGHSNHSPPPTSRSKSFRDPYASERPGASRRTQSDSMPRGGGHWVNSHSGESRAINERRRFDDMDEFDRELQADATTTRKGGSKFGGGSGPRYGKKPGRDHGMGSPGGKSWASNYSFGNGRPPQGGGISGAGRRHSSYGGGGYGDDSDQEDSYRPRQKRTGDYEADLHPTRNGGGSARSGGGYSGNTVGNRPTSPIEDDYTSSRAAPVASSAAPPANEAVGDETLVMAKFAYKPASSDTDISFAAGDVIRVTKRTGTRDDWWSGECHGKVGWFPANYTVDL